MTMTKKLNKAFDFNTSNSGPKGPGFKPRQSRCFLRQGTLLHFASLLPV